MIFIERKIYFSWEQFFTACLQRMTKGTFLQYKKSSLNSAYLHPREAEAILKTLPEQVRLLLNNI